MLGLVQGLRHSFDRCHVRSSQVSTFQTRHAFFDLASFGLRVLEKPYDRVILRLLVFEAGRPGESLKLCVVMVQFHMHYAAVVREL